MNAPGCSGKRAYDTRRDAERARRGLAEKDTMPRNKRRRQSIAEGLNVYHCPHCGAWHMGRPRGKPGPRRPSHGDNSLRALAARYWSAIREDDHA